MASRWPLELLFPTRVTTTSRAQKDSAAFWDSTRSAFDRIVGQYEYGLSFVLRLCEHQRIVNFSEPTGTRCGELRSIRELQQRTQPRERNIKGNCTEDRCHQLTEPLVWRCDKPSPYQTDRCKRGQKPQIDRPRRPVAKRRRVPDAVHYER